MIVTIHQPCFFPYLGVLRKIARADALVLLDDVQYTKGEYFERNRIKAPCGCKWFKVPLSYRFGDKLNEVAINDAIDWRRRFIETLDANYREAPFYQEYIGGIREVVRQDYHTLSEVSAAAMRHILGLFHISPSVSLSSAVPVAGAKTARLVEICKHAGATKYLSGVGGRLYLDESLFIREGIEVEYIDFNSPAYPQLYGGPFTPNLSCLDYLFNCGPDPKILR